MPFTFERLLPWEIPGWCEHCAVVHTQEQRSRILRRMLPCDLCDITDAWSCIWPTLNRKLYRDLHKIGATKLGGGYLNKASKGHGFRMNLWGFP